MMDGGRVQRRDHFRERHEAKTTEAKTTHWREDKVGVVLSMSGEEHAIDPAPEFPE
jgi:hypothetical protein